MMEIRNIRQEELDEAIAMSEFAFQYKLPPERREQVLADMKPERMWGCYDEGKLVSKMTIHAFETWIHGVTFKMGGIAGVATWPEYRRKGLVSGLLKHGLQVMKEMGQTVSMLHPFSFPFYRKFGWETLTEYRKYELETNQLPVYPAYTGRIIRGWDMAKMQGVYEPFAKQYSGMLVRDESWWNKLFRDKKVNFAVYENTDYDVRGYVMYDVKDFLMTIEELVALDEEARRALWRFIADHDSMLKKVTLQAPMDDALPFMLQDPLIKQEIKPYFMVRIVDVQPFLEQFPWVARHTGDDLHGSIRLHVRDEHAAWNNGYYEIIRPGDTQTVTIRKLDFGAAAESAEVENGALTCDIQTLAAMLFGYKRPRFMHQIGRLQGQSEHADELERWIPGTVTAFMDFF